MAEKQLLDQPHPLDHQVSSPSQKDDMLACVMALEASLLPCLPARELQAIDRSPHPSHQSELDLNSQQHGFSGVCRPFDVERHARDFMEAAKKLQLYFISLQQEEKPSEVDTLRKEIKMMEDELKSKTELISKHEKLIQGWRKEVKEQLDKHITELERV